MFIGQVQCFWGTDSCGGGGGRNEKCFIKRGTYNTPSLHEFQKASIRHQLIPNRLSTHLGVYHKGLFAKETDVRRCIFGSFGRGSLSLFVSLAHFLLVSLTSCLSLLNIGSFSHLDELTIVSHLKNRMANAMELMEFLLPFL